MVNLVVNRRLRPVRRCFGAGVGVERVVGHDAAQGLGGLGLVDFGQSRRRLKADVGVERVVGHDAAQSLGAPGWIVFGRLSAASKRSSSSSSYMAVSASCERASPYALSVDGRSDACRARAMWPAQGA